MLIYITFNILVATFTSSLLHIHIECGILHFMNEIDLPVLSWFTFYFHNQILENISLPHIHNMAKYFCPENEKTTLCTCVNYIL